MRVGGQDILTHSRDPQRSHNFLPKFATELTQLGDGQCRHEAGHAVQGDHRLLARLVHARRQLGQDLVVCNACMHPCDASEPSQTLADHSAISTRHLGMKSTT